MPKYVRAHVPGGTFFFTAALLERQRSLLIEHLDVLRDAFRETRRRHPFTIDAIVILPDHFHAVRTLPSGDADFSTCIRLIKGTFSRKLPKHERLSAVRAKRNERGIWQRRLWEHTIRGDEGLRRHIDDVHHNPVKHGHVCRVVDWPHSTFHRYVAAGIYPHDWAGAAESVRDERA